MIVQVGSQPDVGGSGHDCTVGSQLPCANDRLNGDCIVDG